MTSFTILLTCHNRKEKTRQCIQSLYDVRYQIEFVVIDDGSTDGTGDMLSELKEQMHISVLKGDGELYWCGGMRKGIAYALEQNKKTDYYVLVNDDVIFNSHALQEAVKQSCQREDAVVAGSFCDKSGKLTYGGIRYFHRSIKYNIVDIEDKEKCDTFNCNFVLLPRMVFEAAGNLDGHYSHAMADFDYGLFITRIGFTIYSSDQYLGICEKNKTEGTWMDVKLPIRERIRRKEMPKGLPMREWFYFLLKNFGLCRAIWHSMTPYLRILAGR